MFSTLGDIRIHVGEQDDKSLGDIMCTLGDVQYIGEI